MVKREFTCFSKTFRIFEPRSAKTGLNSCMFSQISLCSPHRLIMSDTSVVSDFCFEETSFKQKIHKAESVVQDKPVRTAQAYLGRQVTHML